ncbi:glycosyltransferase family 2 protein [Pueribacillus theae]|uniref:Glycosyltransferase family 2 protein n=1 Tax=Pueribacillus theae TaxID=2171751 RepID=A0A2U1K781_9BACI|nr:glycosyltransferase family 2 protein [Pueribacillus theae]PWA12738.1 glycosyltransferase family 2 protein [Pueribacillus theae]
MKDIHVLFLDNPNQFALEKALHSLDFMKERVAGATIFENRHSFKLHSPSIDIKVEYKTIEKGDLGQTLNNYAQTLTCKYVLFFYGYDYLSSAANQQSFHLNPTQSVITYAYNLQNIVIQRPIFVKTSALQQKKLLSKQQVPFKEAVLSSWLMGFAPSEVKTLKENVVKHIRKKANANALHKQLFLKKFTSQPSLSRVRLPSLAIMISNYNMAQYVETAVTSCMLQNEPADQILIVDDGSTDGSYSRLKKWEKIPGIQLLRKKNGGKARALNQLIPYIDTEFVLELDADDWLDPDALSTMKRLLSVLPKNAVVLYGNLKVWKQGASGEMHFKATNYGKPVKNKQDLLSYRFPLGPRIYRTSSLKENGGFPVIGFQDGRLYEDVSILNGLIKKGQLYYQDFTVYNVREHNSSITKKNHPNWNDFKKYLT